MMRRWLPIALTAAALLAGGLLEVAWGQTPPGLDNLSPDERAVVERNLERWRRLPPEERQRFRQHMTPAERQRPRQLTPEQRQQLRRERRGEEAPR